MRNPLAPQLGQTLGAGLLTRFLKREAAEVLGAILAGSNSPKQRFAFQKYCGGDAQALPFVRAAGCEVRSHFLALTQALFSASFSFSFFFFSMSREGL